MNKKKTTIVLVVSILVSIIILSVLIIFVDFNKVKEKLISTFKNVFPFKQNVVVDSSSAEVISIKKFEIIYNDDNYVVEGLPKEVDVTLIGRKANLYLAKQSAPSSIKIDLTGLKPGKHKIELKYDLNQIQNVSYKLNPSSVEINILPKEASIKSVSYKFVNEDKLDSKLLINEVLLSEESVVIKGSSNKIKSVDKVDALIDLSNLKNGEQTLNDVPLKAYDMYGNVVDVEIIPNEISAKFNVSSSSKVVPIKVETIGNPLFGFSISSLNLNKESVVIYGDEKSLSNINYVVAQIDIDGLSSDKKYKVDLIKPQGVKMISDNTIIIDIKLSNNSSSKTIDNVLISFRNLDKKYNVQVINLDDLKTDVIIQGDEKVINNIDSSDINAYIDLLNFVPGKYEIEVLVNTNNPIISCISKKQKINIIISEK